MVADASKVWIGLEYFCYETDPIWAMPDEELKVFAAAELEKIGILKTADVLDGHVVRVPKTYPAYFGTYNRFDELRSWTDTFENLFLVGRNGMHKYNNQDHSMLTAWRWSTASPPDMWTKVHSGRSIPSRNITKKKHRRAKE